MVKLHVKSASFSTDNSRTWRLSIFYRISNHKIFIPKYFDIVLQISLKLQEHRGGYWRKKLPWMILEEQFPVPESKIGNSVISLLWQLRCHCNPDHNKFSSLFNTTVAAIFFFLNFVYGDVVYAQTWEVLALENCIEPP